MILFYTRFNFFFFFCSSNSKGNMLTNICSSKHLTVNSTNRNTKTKCEICSKLTIRIPERRRWRRFGTGIVNFENIFHTFFWVLIFDFEQVNKGNVLSGFFLFFYCSFWTIKCFPGCLYCWLSTGILPLGLIFISVNWQHTQCIGNIEHCNSVSSMHSYW